MCVRGVAAHFFEVSLALDLAVAALPLTVFEMLTFVRISLCEGWD